MGDLEIIDKLCEVTTLQNDIIREQAMIIRQSEIIDAFEKERDDANNMLDVIELELRNT
jgi:hypothetical protein